MKTYSKYFLFFLSALLSISVFAKNVIFLNEVKNNNGSKWVIEKNDEDYNLVYFNKEGEVYNNNTLITSDIEGSSLFLDASSGNTVSLVMNYPKDIYSIKFSSEKTPRLLSACKRITLPSVEKEQAVALLTLCSNKGAIKDMILPNLDVDRLFASENLTLDSKVKTIIGSERSFLYDDNKNQKNKKPYLIKGDVVEIQEYKNSMLKVKYKSKSKDNIAWIKFVDIL